MARGRLISRSLGSSRKFAALGRDCGRLGEFAQVLFPLLVANADDYGRQSGDAFTVKHAVFPTSARREEDFASALTGMQQAGLIEWYHADGLEVVQIVGFDDHQPNLHKRSEKSKFPGHSGSSGKIPEFPSELNLTELKRTQPKSTALTRVGSDGFTAFWDSYPKKKSRADAEKAWRKLAPSPELTQRIYDAVAAQRKSPDWLKEDGKFIPYAASWLRGERWQDEAEVAADERRSWRMDCHHEPACGSYDWHCVLIARDRGEAV